MTPRVSPAAWRNVRRIYYGFLAEEIRMVIRFRSLLLLGTLMILTRSADMAMCTPKRFFLGIITGVIAPAAAWVTVLIWWLLDIKFTVIGPIKQSSESPPNFLIAFLESTIVVFIYERHFT